MKGSDLIKREWCVLGNVSASDCLRAGWLLLKETGAWVILAWVLGGVVGAPMLFLIPQDLSTGMMLAFLLGGLLVVPASCALVRMLAPDEGDTTRRSFPTAIRSLFGRAESRSFLATTASVLIGLAAVATVFRFATFYTWFAVPFTGGIAYAFVTFGVDNLSAAGRLDMLVGAIVWGLVGFGVAIGFLFAPLRAIQDRLGPLASVRAAWRMVGARRWLLLKMFACCLGIPAALCVVGFAFTYVRFGIAYFNGIQAVLWSLSAASLVVFFGPWLTCSLAILYVPQKALDETFLRRLAERKAGVGIS